ncbi:hypothetical protein D3C72_2519060 [compost metagenome]
MSRNHRVTGRVTVKNIFDEVETITSTAPLSMSLRRISRSDPPASEVEFAMTNPARPVSFSAALKSPIQR